MDMATALAELGVTQASLDPGTRERLDRDGYAPLPGVLSAVQVTAILQVRLRRHAPVHAIGRGLLIAQELHRHRPAPYEPNAAEFRQRVNLLSVRLP